LDAQRSALTCVLLLLGLLPCNSAWSLSGQHVVALKKAGVSDQTIEVIAQERLLECAAFSIDEIVEMKKVGVGEETMRVIFKEGSCLRDSETVVYGRSTQTVRNISPEEIIAFKKNGISDEVIRSVIEASKSDSQQDRERAWRMLENMRLRVFTRHPPHDRRPRTED